MKKLLILLVPLFLCGIAYAQEDPADAIIGNYDACYKGREYKVRIYKRSDGKYRAQVTWFANSTDPKTGEKLLDVKNPDKSKRDTPCDRIVLSDGLQYDAEKNQWSKAKIYDPQTGIKVNVTMRFDEPGKLAVRGSMLGIGVTIYWYRQ